MHTSEAFFRRLVSVAVTGCVIAAALGAWPSSRSIAQAAQAAPPAPVAQPAAAGQQPATIGQGKENLLPGGATSVQETHADWRVVCAQQNGKKVCALSQQQTDNNTRQLMLAIELASPVANKAEGTLILPFGLALDRGLTLQIDDGATAQALRFRTCLPVGCLVALTFDSATVALLKKGSVLTVKATADGGQEADFKISLKGFGSALDRTSALAQ